VLMLIEHVAMPLAMAGAMLRPDEYTHHHTRVEPAIAEQVTA
jgi:hypothetical protein